MRVFTLHKGALIMHGKSYVPKGDNVYVTPPLLRIEIGWVFKITSKRQSKADV